MDPNKLSLFRSIKFTFDKLKSDPYYADLQLRENARSYLMVVIICPVASLNVFVSNNKTYKFSTALDYIGDDISVPHRYRPACGPIYATANDVLEEVKYAYAFFHTDVMRGPVVDTTPSLTPTPPPPRVLPPPPPPPKVLPPPPPPPVSSKNEVQLLESKRTDNIEVAVQKIPESLRALLGEVQDVSESPPPIIPETLPESLKKLMDPLDTLIDEVTQDLSSLGPIDSPGIEL